jgi:hypothetical protein
MRTHRVPFAVLFLALLVTIFPPLLQARETAQTEPPMGKSKSEGFFLGFSARTLAFKGDLDGKLVLWHFEKAFYSPRLDPSVGLALHFGVKRNRWLWEAGYVQSGFAARLPDRASRATYRAGEISGKSILFPDARLEPYILLGVGVPFLTVRDGSELRGVRTNASFVGIGFLLGAGVALDVTPSLFVSAGAGYRVLGYFYASGEGKGRDITELHVGYEGPVWRNWLRTSTLEITVDFGFVL